MRFLSHSQARGQRGETRTFLAAPVRQRLTDGMTASAVAVLPPRCATQRAETAAVCAVKNPAAVHFLSSRSLFPPNCGTTDPYPCARAHPNNPLGGETTSNKAPRGRFGTSYTQI